jgi:peptide/nickel transport system ATP-binding protein
MFEGKDIAHMSKSEFRAYRQAVQIIHQDPYASLNPVHTVGDTLRAPLLHHKRVKSRRDATAKAGELLELVDCRPVENFIDKFPHQLSGGQRQRISIARAMTLNPRMIIADESVSMVDVSIRVSLLNTLLKLRNDLDVTFLFITHDLAVVKYFGWEGRVGVMYVGKLIEYGRTPQLIGRSMHPYTRALAAAIPEADPDLTRSKRKLHLRSLDIPSLNNLPPGCVFNPRCPYWEEGLCDVLVPPLTSIGKGRDVACHVVVRDIARGGDGITSLDEHASNQAAD